MQWSQMILILFQLMTFFTSRCCKIRTTMSLCLRLLCEVVNFRLYIMWFLNPSWSYCCCQYCQAVWNYPHLRLWNRHQNVFRTSSTLVHRYVLTWLTLKVHNRIGLFSIYYNISILCKCSKSCCWISAGWVNLFLCQTNTKKGSHSKNQVVLVSINVYSSKAAGNTRRRRNAGLLNAIIQELFFFF